MFKLTIPGKLPSYNDQQKADRGNKYKGATLKRETEEFILFYIKFQGLGNKKLNKCMLEFCWVDKSNRDPDNIVFAKKYILDALQKSNTIVNDTKKNVLGFVDKLVTPKHKNDEKIIVKIIDMEGE